MVQADVYLTDILIGPSITIPLSDWLLGVSYCEVQNWRQLASIRRSRATRVCHSWSLLIVNLLFLYIDYIRLEFSRETIYKRYSPKY